MTPTSLRRLALVLALLSGFVASAQIAGEPSDVAALRIKAEKGNSIAQYNLGLVYVEGREVPVDLAEAYVWLNLASEGGTTSKALQDLVTNMTP
ncbi:MAG: hypothetical protein ACHQ4G_09865, partial [Opitutales bacterium]